jgi:hypothetical protein
LTDLRKANGKQYSLETLLMIILMAKLRGENTPREIVGLAKHCSNELVETLYLSKPKMLHHNTYRRILAYKVYTAEYNQQGGYGQV